MSNTLTIELCQEDRARLDSVITFLHTIACELKAGTPDLKVVAPHEQPAPAEEHPVDAVAPHGEPEPVAEPEAPKYTKEDVQAKVQKLAKPGSPKRLEAKAIVNEYAVKVSDIPEDKFAEVMAKLNALEG